MSSIKYIDTHIIDHKRILLRVDFNVSLTAKNEIADDVRIRQAIPTVTRLLENHNKLIIASHLGRPKKRDEEHSLKIIIHRLQEYLPHTSIKLVTDFLSDDKTLFEQQQEGDILLLENIRFYPEEKKNDTPFAKRLASLADVFVNDAFGVSHRISASVVGITEHLPSYAGLLMKREVEMIGRVIEKPKSPLIAIIGGAKISTKINLISTLLSRADYLIVGGGLANTFLAAEDCPVGKSMVQYEEIEHARKLIYTAARMQTSLIMPSDVIVTRDNISGEVRRIDDVHKDEAIVDIGPETQATIGNIVTQARTIIWNGPVGYFEVPAFRVGTDFIYYAITQNEQATSIVGGGDTLTAISKKEYLENITHISTGGGAMLEFIENGTLPGLEALKKQ